LLNEEPIWPATRFFIQQSKFNNQQFLRRQRTAQRAFQFQQLSLDIETATVAAQGSIGRDYAMARHNDRYGISIVRHAHGAKSPRPPDRAGDVGIGASFAEWNSQQRSPAGQLEVGSTEVKGKREFATLASEIFFEFPRIS
jgi:hypothetical protein